MQDPQIPYQGRKTGIINDGRRNHYDEALPIEALGVHEYFTDEVYLTL
jgi:hypothetical protein